MTDWTDAGVESHQPHPGINKAASGYTQFFAEEDFREAEDIHRQTGPEDSFSQDSRASDVLHLATFFGLAVIVILLITHPDFIVSVLDF